MRCHPKTGCPSTTHNLQCGYPNCEKGAEDSRLSPAARLTTASGPAGGWLVLGGVRVRLSEVVRYEHLGGGFSTSGETVIVLRGGRELTVIGNCTGELDAALGVGAAQ